MGRGGWHRLDDIVILSPCNYWFSLAPIIDCTEQMKSLGLFMSIGLSQGETNVLMNQTGEFSRILVKQSFENYLLIPIFSCLLAGLQLPYSKDLFQESGAGGNDWKTDESKNQCPQSAAAKPLNAVAILS